MRNLLIFLFCISAVYGLTKKHLGRKIHGNSPKQSVGDFIGCPYNNDFYYNGVIASPLYPNVYPPNDKCWYYLQAKPGSVLSINFTHFDLDTNDFITIYDGPTDIFPVLAQLGGNVTQPQVYYSSERFALVTFTSSATGNPKSGFSFNYDSVYTAYPCNRDILLGINAMGGLKNSANYLRQLSFISNLISNWTIGIDKVRVFINLQTDADFAIVFPATDPDMLTTAGVQKTIMDLSEYAPNIVDNDTVTDFNGMFRYLEDDISFHPEDNGERDYTQKVVILFVATNANTDQDYNEAWEYAHKMKNRDDTKVIIVAMGPSLDVARIGKLAYGEGFYFAADYKDLNTLTSKVNAAICAGLDSKCGP
ncbi:unnamed protein product, partial [Mesorhabditis spiculigera]